MPLYEVVLRFADREETRLTDRNYYRLGRSVRIDYRRFRVVGVESAVNARVEARFVLEPLRGEESGVPAV